MIPYILYDIERTIRRPENKVPDPENFQSYLGQITYCKKMFHYHFDGEIFLEPNENSSDLFKELNFSLSNKPMGRVGMDPDGFKNLMFLQKELDCWTGKISIDHDDAPWMSYREMWEGIPNVSECAYAKLMSAKYIELLDKLKIVVAEDVSASTIVSMNRTYLVNFPSASFCPISFGFCFDYQPTHDGEYRVALLVMINFRSLEVSRNLKNDLYLFLGFLRRLIFAANPDMEDSIPIVSLTINSMDAHIIDL